MNWNYLMAGSVSTNPLLLVGAILLIVAWRVAGYYGLDRYLLLTVEALATGTACPSPLSSGVDLAISRCNIPFDFDSTCFGPALDSAP